MLIFMTEWKNKVAFIAGLSKGIGEVVAPKFATMGI